MGRIQATGTLGLAVWLISAGRILARYSAFLALGLIGLASCTMDKEGAVRAQLNKWVILGETDYFKSGWDCTGGVFLVSSDTVKNKIKTVNSVERGLRFIAKDQPVAFEINGQTPDQVHKALDKADRLTGVVILVSALAAKDCFGEELAAEFFQVLNDQNAVLMYDPENAAMALFDRAGDRIFYARGSI